MRRLVGAALAATAIAWAGSASAATVIDFEDRPEGSIYAENDTIGPLNSRSEFQLVGADSATATGKTGNEALIYLLFLDGYARYESIKLNSFLGHTSYFTFSNDSESFVFEFTTDSDKKSWQTVLFPALSFTPHTLSIESGDGAVTIDDLAFDFVSPYPVAGIPEPGMWAMMIMGFGMAGAALRSQARTGKFVVRFA